MKEKIRNSFKTKAFRVGGYSVIAVVIVLAIVVAVNILVSKIPSKYTQFDTTSNQLFSISEQTEKLVSGLTEEVELYWIVRAGSEDSTLSLLLNQYEGLGPNLKIIKKDPDVYPTFVSQYTEEAADNSIVVTCGDRYRYVDYYDIYEYDYSNYYYNYSYEVNFAGESAITSAIDYVTSDSLPKIYSLTNHGEADLPADYQDQINSQNIELEEFTLLTAEEIPEDADAIMIYNPSTDISNEEKEMLEDYLAMGGNLLLITNPPEDTEFVNLEALMEPYGVSAADGIVVEGNSGYYAYRTPYYLLPDKNSHAITDPLIENGYYVILPISQGLEVSDSVPEGVTVTELLTTSVDSFSKIAGWDLSTYEKEEGDLNGPFALAVAVEDQIDEDTVSHIVWISSAAVADESANQMVSGGNQDFFLNSIGWMCQQGESSISIHSKSLSNETVTISDGAASALAILFIGIIPLLYLAIGIIKWVRRRHR